MIQHLLVYKKEKKDKYMQEGKENESEREREGVDKNEISTKSKMLWKNIDICSP